MRFLLITILLLGFQLFGQEVKLGLPVGPSNYIRKISHDPNGKRILATSADKSVYVWDLSTQKLVYNFVQQVESQNAEFSLDGENILVSSDSSIVIYDLKLGKKIMEFSNIAKSSQVSGWINGQTFYYKTDKDSISIINIRSKSRLNLFSNHSQEAINQAFFARNSNYLLTTNYSNNDVVVWNPLDGKEQARLIGHSAYISEIKFLKSMNMVLTASGDHTVKLWDLNSFTLLRTFEGHTETVTAVDFNEEESRIVSCSGNGEMKVWNLDGSLVTEHQLHLSDRFSTVQVDLSPSGRYVVSAGNGFYSIWDCEQHELVDSSSFGFSWNYSANFHPEKDLVAITLYNQAIFYNLTTNQCDTLYLNQNNSVTDIDFGPFGDWLTFKSDKNTLSLYNLENQILNKFETQTVLLQHASLGPTKSTFCSTSYMGESYIWDLSTGKALNTIPLVWQLQYDSKEKFLLTGGGKFHPILFNLEEHKVLHQLNDHESVVNHVSFSPSGDNILTSSQDKSVKVWNSKSTEVITTLEHEFKVNSAFYSADNKLIFSTSNGGEVKIFDATTFEELSKMEGSSVWLNEALLDDINQRVINVHHDTIIRVWNLNGSLLKELHGHSAGIEHLKKSLDGNFILSGGFDGKVLLWDIDNNSKQLLFHDLNGWIRYVDFINKDSEILIITSKGELVIYNVELKKMTDCPNMKINYPMRFMHIQGNLGLVTDESGMLSILDLQEHEILIKKYIFDSDPKKWVHLHPSGLFDASPEAMELMYWTKGLEVIEFAQLKDRYWVPGLWEKVMKGETLPDVRGMNELKLQPEVQLGQVVDGKLPITLIKRDGGYGAVSISINGKEVISDARGNDIDTTKQVQTIYYSIKDHPYLQNGENVISVKASSADGFVTGRGEGFKYLMEKKESEKPNFYALVIGVSDYVNDAIDLKYPEKDAKALAEAVKLGAGNLFGTEKSEVYTVTAAEGKRPNKETIQAAFKQVASKAKAQDVLMVYLSGHGVTWGGDQGDFYFLTADATAAHKDAYNDPAIRSTATISSSEMVEWIKEIPALKQVMIIDACGSGKALDNLVAARDVESSQIKAIDRMKDRTGMFVISGCAADAVSYEASQYGQGLLTYAILQAMKGAALKEDKYVDVFTILQHARENVPKLAAGLGGIQEPQFLHPKGGSFDIGILEQEDKAKIALAEPKRVFVRSVLVEKSKYRDVLGLSTLLNNALSDLSSRGADAQLVFFDAEEYGNSCQLTGGYKELDGIIELDLNIVCNGSEMTHQLKASSSTELVEQIIELVNK